MDSYTHEYSKLPHQLYTRHYFKDVDDTVGNLINQIKLLQQQGKYDKVNEIIKNNKENLQQYALGADYINAIDEEIRNLEIFASEKRQVVYYVSNEPGGALINDIWISD